MKTSVFSTFVRVRSLYIRQGGGLICLTSAKTLMLLHKKVGKQWV